MSGNILYRDFPSAVNYSTSFAANENPISESGNWTRPGPSAFNNDMFTTGGRAFGAAAASGTNDAVACLVGSYLPNQDVTVTWYENGGSVGAAEMEVHLCVSFDATNVYLYEFDFINGQSVNLVKWQGPQSSIFIFSFEAGTDGTASGGNFVNGDQIRCVVTGSASSRLLQCYHKGVLIAQTHDTTAISGNAPYTTGNPGIGGDNGGANYQNIGFETFSAITTALG